MKSTILLHLSTVFRPRFRLDPQNFYFYKSFERSRFISVSPCIDNRADPNHKTILSPVMNHTIYSYQNRILLFIYSTCNFTSHYLYFIRSFLFYPCICDILQLCFLVVHCSHHFSFLCIPIFFNPHWVSCKQLFIVFMHISI